VATLYVLGRVRAGLAFAAYAVPLAVLAVLMVVAKGVWRIVLMPFHHLALGIVTVAVALEGLLAGRVFVQLAYEDNVQGLGGRVLTLTDPLVEPFKGLEGTAILHDTGVVEFATLTAMEAVLIATIAAVVVLMFWSEFLHMYRRIRDFFAEQSERRQARTETVVEEEPVPPMNPSPLPEMSTASADLSAAS